MSAVQQGTFILAIVGKKNPQSDSVGLLIVSYCISVC